MWHGPSQRVVTARNKPCKEDTGTTMADQLDSEQVQRFCRRVAQRETVVGVVGLGYVGLPMAMAFIHAGFRVVGFDKNPARIAQLRDGLSFLPDVSSAQLHAALREQRLFLSEECRALALAEAVVICVPTPVTRERQPDLRHVLDAVSTLGPVLRPGALVVLESTTYPGTTEELVQPALETAGFRVGEDVFLCYSPERVDPANPKYQPHNIPKILAGRTKACQQAGMALYSSVVERVVPVSSTRAAEMVKLVENVFRNVNIALANEMAMLSAELGVDAWEVIAAASTKPFGFMPFYPGPGTGGHCIPVDPLYLQWKAQGLGLRSRLIELATEINESMPGYVAAQVDRLLQGQGKRLNGASVLLLGLAYKRDVGDTRESPAVQLLELLQERGCRVFYHDPLVPEFVAPRGQRLISSPITSSLLREVDCVVLTTDHSDLPYAGIAAQARLIVDTRNGFRGIQSPSIYRLGVPWPDRGAARNSAQGPRPAAAVAAEATG